MTGNLSETLTCVILMIIGSIYPTCAIILRIESFSALFLMYQSHVDFFAGAQLFLGVAQEHFFASTILSCDNRNETGNPKILGH